MNAGAGSRGWLRPLEWIYRAGVKLDRSFTTVHRLPAPVLSIGNLSVGGRGKTPLVIHSARQLLEMGRKPVVLTRGYGRRSHMPVFMLANAGGLVDARVEECGDEALEIFLLSGADVLVGAKRHLSARAWWERASEAERRRAVFVLDDGFQHWSLARDLDVVLIQPIDREDRVLPAGHLREDATALARADCVLEMPGDFCKTTRVDAARLRGGRWISLTTRAEGSFDRGELLRAAGTVDGAAVFCELRDHAPREEMLAALRSADSRARRIVVGPKEAVKLFDLATLRTLFQRKHLTVAESDLDREVILAEVVLTLKDPARYRDLLRTLGERPARKAP